MTRMTLLQARRVTRSFGGVHAVANVDLRLHEGEFVSIIGPNGAGKTTLFNLLSGHDKPDSGSIVFDGVAVGGWTPERVAGLGLAAILFTLRCGWRRRRRSAWSAVGCEGAADSRSSCA